MGNNEQFEDLLKKAVEHKFDDQEIRIPPSDATWLKIEQEVSNKTRKRAVPKHIKRASWVVATAVIAFTLLIVPQSTTAFSKLFQIFDGWKDDMIRIVSKSPVQDTSAKLPRPDHKEEMDTAIDATYKEVTLEEARSMVTFDIKLPELPTADDYRLTDVSIWYSSDDHTSDKVRLNYEGEEAWFSIVEEKSRDRSIHSQAAVGVFIEEVLIGNNEGILVTYSSDLLGLNWIVDGVQFSIYGKLSKEQIVYIAEQL